MGGAHLAGGDGGDGDEGRAISHGRGQTWAATPDVQGHQRRFISPAEERDPPAAGHGRADERSETARVPGSEGLHLLRALPAGLHRALEVATQPAREAVYAHQLRADGAYGR